jgi:hypothetical protein
MYEFTQHVQSYTHGKNVYTQVLLQDRFSRCLHAVQFYTAPNWSLLTETSRFLPHIIYVAMLLAVGIVLAHRQPPKAHASRKVRRQTLAYYQ